MVASNLEGIKDAIQDGKNGILVKPRYAQEYVSSIRKLLEDDDLRKRFGAQARQFTLDNYGWEKMAQNYLHEFVELG